MKKVLAMVAFVMVSVIKGVEIQRRQACHH